MKNLQKKVMLSLLLGTMVGYSAVGYASLDYTNGGENVLDVDGATVVDGVKVNHYSKLYHNSGDLKVEFKGSPTAMYWYPYGLEVVSDAEHVMAENATLDIKGVSYNGYGIYGDLDAKIELNGKVNVSMSDDSEFDSSFNSGNLVGAKLFSGSKLVTSEKGMDINVSRKYSGGTVFGLSTTGNGTQIDYNGGKITVESTSPLSEGKTYCRGIDSNDGSVINVNGYTEIRNSSENKSECQAVFASGENTVVNINADVKTYSKSDSNLIQAYAPSGYGTVNINKGVSDLTVVAKDNWSMAVGIGANAFVNSKEGTVINADVTGNASYGVYAHTNAVGTFDGDVNMKLHSEKDKATAFYALRNAALNFNGKVNVESEGDGAYAHTGGVINLAGDTVMNVTGNVLRVAGATGAATVNVNQNGGKTVQLIGNVLADGDGENVININLDNANSFLTGASLMESSDAAVNMKLSNGAVWNVTGDSVVNELVNNSVVNMLHTNDNDDEILEIAKLSGNGTFIMNTHLQKSFDEKHVYGAGDKIIITEASSGDHVINIRDASLDYGQSAEGYLLLVSDYSGGTATFTKGTVDHGGVFKYKPIITNENPDEEEYEHLGAGSRMARSAEPEATHWYLTGYETIDDLMEEGVTEEEIEENYLSDNTKSTIDLNNTRYVNYLMDHDTLQKRLGELRMVQQNKDQDNDGIWARFRKGSMTTDTLDGDFKTYQLGYDKEITPGRRYVGAAVSHTDSNYNGSVGSAEGDMTALSIYNTWLGEKSHYLDLVAKAGRMHGDSNYNDDSFAEKGSYKTMFYSLSAEYGRKNMNDNGFYYEPQAQLTLGRINGDNYVTSLGTEVQQDAVNSVLGRVGLTFGKEFNMDKPESRSNIYAKVNLMHEFAGDSKVTLTDTRGDSYTASKDYGGTWLNVGVGASANIGKSTNLYMDFEKNFGGEVKSNWIGQVGLRVSF